MGNLRNLCFAHLGNGLTVYDTNSVVGNDYEIVAHIGYDRHVCYRKNITKPLTSLDISIIETRAATDTSTISITQQTPVLCPLT